ncbi:hypothetical protein [Streptomyces sp. NPDC003688]
MRTRSIVASALCAAGAVGGLSTLAVADPAPPTGSIPYAVEDFNYPGADQILATKGILLKRGDGHIVLTECGQNANEIRVYTVKDSAANRDAQYCFKPTASTGFLTLELPRVFALETGDHPISADLTVEGQTTQVDVPEGGFKSVGEGTVGGAQSVLVEIRVTG